MFPLACFLAWQMSLEMLIKTEWCRKTFAVKASPFFKVAQISQPAAYLCWWVFAVSCQGRADQRR
jgi:hypothetical protein